MQSSRWNALAWASGAGGGLVVLGPALGGGSLLNLDLVVTPRVRLPPGVWGLGPELPRRVPLMAPIAALSHVVPGPAVWVALVAFAVAAGCAGVYRLADGAQPVARLGAGLFYALSPFVLTRIGVGHTSLVVATAILPWALPTLLTPADQPWRTFLWSAALGLCGVFGAVLAGPILLVGLARRHAHDSLKVSILFVASQLLWLVPGIVVLAQGSHLAGSASFATDLHGFLGPLRLLGGHGFWQRANQVGATTDWVAGILGLAVFALALAGWRDLPGAWARAAVAAAGLGLLLPAASAVPGVRSLYDALTRLPIGAPFRESQRVLPLYLVVAAPAAALGATRLVRDRRSAVSTVLPVVPLAVAAVLAGPGLWGLGGRLEPVHFPSAWSRIRAAVHAQPGTVLALPWHEYLDFHLAADRRVYNPLPDYLGGDVLVSSDPELGSGAREQADPREPSVIAMLRHQGDEAATAQRLRDLGIRWVALLHDVDWRSYGSIVHNGILEPVVTTHSIDLLRVRSWRGPVEERTGRVLPVHPLVEPLERVASSGPATWKHPAAAGWLRGWASAGRSRDGLVSLPGGRGVLWYWPTLVVLSGDTLTVCLVLAAWMKIRRPRTGRH